MRGRAIALVVLPLAFLLVQLAAALFGGPRPGRTSHTDARRQSSPDPQLQRQPEAFLLLPPPPPPASVAQDEARRMGAARRASVAPIAAAVLSPPPPPRNQMRPGPTAASDPPLAHVVVGADRVHWPGVVGVVNSLVANSATPDRLRIHALAPAGLEGAFRTYLRCQGLSPDAGANARLRVLGFDAHRVPPIKVQTRLTNLESPLNFARFYLAEMLPGVDKVFYVDADVIVQGDAVQLLRSALPHGELCAATLRRTTLGDKGVASLRGERLRRRFRERYGFALPLKERGFNAGVFVFNLAKWAALNLTAEVEYWVRANNREKLYSLGSQPPLTLAVHGAPGGRCQPLPSEWHVDCLGCMGAGRLKSEETLRAARLLHWNGPNKPFAAGAGRPRAHRELFKPYEGRGGACEVGGDDGGGGDGDGGGGKAKRSKAKKPKKTASARKAPKRVS